MKVEEPGEYGNKSKNSMYETVYTDLFYFGNVRGVYRNKNREHIVLIIMTVLILIFSIPGLYFSIKLDFQSFALKVQPSVKNAECKMF